MFKKSFLTQTLFAITLLLSLELSSQATPSSFNLVGQLDPFVGNNRYADVWGEGNYAYIGSFQGIGVGIIDISIPSSPSLVAHYFPSTPGQFKDVKVQSGIGYFATDDGGGIHVVDVSDPTNPSLISQITSTENGYDSIHNIFVDGNFLYEADSRTSRVKVFDISDPSNPFFVRNIVTTDPLFIHDITVVNDRLYTSGFGGTTDIYDVSNIGTTAPTLLGTVNSGPNSHSNWATSDNNLLISAREISDGDVRIFDVSNPASPILLSVIDDDFLGIDALTPHNPLLFNDNLLFVSWYQAGVQAFDISNPSNPVLVGSFDTFPGGVNPPGTFDGNWGVYPFLGLDKVLLSDLDGGLFIVDATTPIPEPSTLLLFTIGIVGTAFYGYRIATKLGHYEILSLLGKGEIGCGEDFRGELQGRHAN